MSCQLFNLKTLDMGAAYRANLLIGPVFSLQKRGPYNRDWLYFVCNSYRVPLKGFGQVSWMLQASWGRSGKQQQQWNSPNQSLLVVPCRPPRLPSLWGADHRCRPTQLHCSHGQEPDASLASNWIRIVSLPWLIRKEISLNVFHKCVFRMIC